MASLNERVADLQDKITKAHVDIKTSDRNEDKLKKKIAKDKAELAELEASKETIMQEFKILEESATQVIMSDGGGSEDGKGPS